MILINPEAIIRIFTVLFWETAHALTRLQSVGYACTVLARSHNILSASYKYMDSREHSVCLFVCLFVYFKKISLDMNHLLDRLFKGNVKLFFSQKKKKKKKKK